MKSKKLQYTRFIGCRGQERTGGGEDVGLGTVESKGKRSKI